mgnify:FL=1|tara:strand:- start:281 stop:469 length:189 start_codon:yes stop_codon:yes gene_type:complete
MKEFILMKLLKSKKVWLGISSIVIPLIAGALGVDESAVSNIWYSCIAMLLGQSFADFGKESK